MIARPSAAARRARRGERRASGFAQALAVTLAMWVLFIYGSYTVSELIGGRTNFLADLPLDLPAVVLIALVAQALYPVAVATRDWRAAPRWLTVFAGAVAAAVVQAAINVGENRLLGVIPRLDAAHLGAIRDRFGRMFLSHVYLTFSNAALFVFLVENRRLAGERLRRARADARAAEARSTALRLQLNPHFLFNALNAISSLVMTRRNAEAEEMLERLAGFLRRSLEADPSGMATLDEEFAVVESYLAIEAVRFGDRLRTEVDLPQALARETVPHFLLQPLVENAVKHGVAARGGPVSLAVRARAGAGRLRLCVLDEGAPAPDGGVAGGLGIGTANVRERLERHYGAAARLTLDRTPERFTATVEMPLGG